MRICRVELERITTSTCIIEIDHGDDVDEIEVEQFALGLAETDDGLEWSVSETVVEVVSMTDLTADEMGTTARETGLNPPAY